MQLLITMHVHARDEPLVQGSEEVPGAYGHKPLAQHKLEQQGHTSEGMHEDTHQDMVLLLLHGVEALRAEVEVLRLQKAPDCAWQSCLRGATAPPLASRPP